MDFLFKLRLSLILVIIFTTRIFSQDTTLSADVKVIETRNFQSKRTSYVVIVEVKNDSDIPIYLPSSLNKFEDQHTDSILIYKKSDTGYTKFKVIYGEQGHAPYVTPEGTMFQPVINDNPITRRYDSLFNQMQYECENLINHYEKSNGRLERKANPLFLKSKVKKTVYVVALSGITSFEEGSYKINFFYGERQDADSLPNSISGYQKVVPKNIKSHDFFFNVTGKDANKIVLNNRE